MTHDFTERLLRSFMELWDWLGVHSSLLQSIVALFNAVVAMVTVWVLIVTWRAVKKQATAATAQADAAHALTDVARDQTKAAIDSAESARRQSDLLSSQIEQSTAPLLVAEPDDRPGFRNYKLVNRGPGVAFKILCLQGDTVQENPGTDIPALMVQKTTLGSSDYVNLPIPGDWDVFTVQYKGLDHLIRWTVVYRDQNRFQEHAVQRGLQKVYLT